MYTKSYFEKNSFRSPNGHFRSILWSGISQQRGAGNHCYISPQVRAFSHRISAAEPRNRLRRVHSLNALLTSAEYPGIVLLPDDEGFTKKKKMSFWFAPLLLSDGCTKYIHQL